MAAENAKTWGAEYGAVILQMTLLNEDRLADADRLFRAYQSRLVESGYVIGQPALQANSGLALLMAGKLDDALVQAEAGLALAEQTNVPVVTAVARGVIARVALHRGSVTEAEAALGPTQPVGGLGVDGLESARALILEAQGDVTAAREALNSTWDSPHRYIIGWVSIGPDLTRLHLAAGDRDQAASVATAVERGASGSDAPSAAGAALRCRALVDSDPALMRRAIASYEHGPRALETAAAREDAAALLGETEAVDELRAALAAYEAAGATGDATRVRASLRRRGVRPGVRGARQRPATGWDSLTPTERQVVALAAEGLTSRQIGDRLYISTFTVGSHLRHVYQKLGINSRLQLAAATRRHQRKDIR
jgi:DNA-binding CsgD family transcriptional regulator